MALAGKGSLVIMTDIPANEEAEFNRWYDREHTQERVAIPGFIRARRWVLAAGEGPKYLALYETREFEVLASVPYKAALAAQTQWSKDVMGRFVNVVRSVSRITRAWGLGSGGVVAVLRIRPEREDPGMLRERIAAALEQAVAAEGIVAAHVLESDPELSKPLPEHKVAPGEDASRDWYLCVEGASPQVALAVTEALLSFHELAEAGGRVLSRGAYTLMWGLTRAEMERENVLRQIQPDDANLVHGRSPL
jgi:hypothetical protein